MDFQIQALNITGSKGSLEPILMLGDEQVLTLQGFQKEGQSGRTIIAFAAAAAVGPKNEGLAAIRLELLLLTA